MRITVKRTDKRHLGSDRFKYYVDIYPEDFSKEFKLILEKFYECRQWCWETFGPSVEYDIWDELNSPRETRNDKWSWDRGQYNKTWRCIIYLKSEQEANWLKLRWGIQ